MSSMKNIASGFAYYLSDELNYDQRQCETVRYGLELIIGTLIKSFVILTISYFLGIMPLAIALSVTSILFRVLAGGAHFSTYSRCLTFSLISVTCISYVSIALSRVINNIEALFLILGLALIGYWFVNTWAPADNPNKPIKRKEGRLLYKKLSKTYVLSWTTIIALVTITSWQSPLIAAICLASAGGFTMQILSISPACYRLVSVVDDRLNGLQARGGE